MVNIILDIIGLLTGTCKTEHRERLFHAVHQITQRGMRSVDSLLYLNLHVRWSVCLSLFVTLVIKNSVRRSDDVGLLTKFGSLQFSKGIFANAPSFKNLCLPKTPCLVRPGLTKWQAKTGNQFEQLSWRSCHQNTCLGSAWLRCMHCLSSGAL